MWRRMTFVVTVLSILMTSCEATRYRGTHSKMIADNENRMGPWFVSSMLECQTFFKKAGYSEAFAMTHRSTVNEEGYDCYGAKSGYSTEAGLSSSWVYEKVTDEQPPRDVTTFTGSPYPECPTVLQKWPPFNDTFLKWTAIKSSKGPGGGMNMALDGDADTTTETTADDKYPWMRINLQRNYRITKLRILTSSNINISNAEVRIGFAKISEKNKMFTQNSRCAFHYGPSSGQEWIEMDCHRAIFGKFISLQLGDQLGGSNPILAIAEIEMYGWGRLCGTEDPWY